jgi:pyruvate dehydrogenase E2 component (dihydrolipoamide acetyltransferase)
MSVSVSMPQLGESVTEGTVTRWLKKEGERVVVDEPLLEVSTDKVDTEIPSPASGILRSIAVDEDETVAVGAQLAVIEDSETSDSAPAQTSPPAQEDASAPPEAATSAQDAAPAQDGAAAQDGAESAPAAEPEPASTSSDAWSTPSYTPPTPGYAPPPAYGQPPSYSQPAAPAQSQPYAAATTQTPAAQPAPAPSQPYAASTTQAPAVQPSAYAQPTSQVPAAPAAPPAQAEAAAESPAPAADEEYPAPTPLPGAGEAPYVTPLVRKLAAEHGVNLETVTGTGVGGRIRKQDVIEAARAQRGSQAAQASPAAQAPQDGPAAVVPQQAQRLPDGPTPATPAGQPAAPAARRPAVVPSSLRGTTQRMSRPRQVIAQRMVESLRTSAQLTTVVEADVTAIARLRDRAKADFEAREGVKLTFLPFFALAAVEALKMHPKLNAVINGDQVTYHDAEHLGVAVDTERGLMVPVIHNAGDLNIGGLARKIGDLAQRTRSGQVGPDELAGGTFTLTNTGSRGALFDTPIINQPQVAILGTGTVVRRPVVVEDPALGEVIAVRSMVYLALTYDHRLVDGADAARFLTTVKNRLEEGAFETELGL